MDQFVVHPINPDLEIRVTRDMPALPADVNERIDVLWRAAAARVEAGGSGPLFNGQVFSIETISPSRITGHLTEYRRLVAQAEDHTLAPVLNVRPLAVCGILRCDGGIAIGRRHASAVYHPGLWQLCPAGSVDGGALREDGTMDYHAQLLTEAREELGLEPRHLGPATALCLIEHPGSHICDLGMAAEIALTASSVLAAHRSRGNDEYDPLRIIAVASLPAFIAWAGAALVPPAPLFLARAGLLP